VILEVIGVIAPFFLVLAAGFGYARRFPTNLDDANLLNLRVFTPALVFSGLTSAPIDFSRMGMLVLVVAVVMVGSGLLSWQAARFFKLPRRVFTACMVFTNTGNMGMPLALLAFGEKGFQLAVLVFVTVNLLHFSLGLAMYSGQWRLRKIIGSPNVIACFLALACNYWSISLPKSLDFSIDLLGQVCIPLMIFSLGVRLAGVDLSHWKTGLVGAVVCPASGLLAALVCVWLIPMPPQYQQSLLLFAALPPAAINLLMAERYRNHPEVTASLVFVGNIASLVVMPLVLLAMQLYYQ